MAKDILSVLGEDSLPLIEFLNSSDFQLRRSRESDKVLIVGGPYKLAELKCKLPAVYLQK